eukprot:SAG31_NODE_2379_length_5836_cov_4.527453_9_plen_177_part_00
MAWQPLSQAALKRVLAAVDASRVAPHAQRLYSQRDDMAWFAAVTDELYRTALGRELLQHGFRDMDGSAVGGCCRQDPRFEPVAERGLSQVYSIRAVVQASDDTEMQKFLSTLLHVRLDRAFSCPLSIGSVLPAELGCHTLNAIDQPQSLVQMLSRVETKREGCSARACVVIAGSWS